MISGGKVLNDMGALLGLLGPYCADRTTVDELVALIQVEKSWSKAHDLFRRIRAKTLVAERSADRKLAKQYLFEEICTKTLYNLSGSNTPFDPDSPYWIIPNALAFARSVGVADAQVIKIVAA